MSEEKRRIHCDRLIRLFASAPIKRTFGMDLSFDNNGSAVFEMDHHPGLEHPLGDLHGGVIATLVDCAGWFTAAAHYDTWLATVELQVRFLEPSRKEKLRASGRLIRAGKSLAVVEMEVRGDGGRLVAVGSGTFVSTSLPY